MKEEIRSKIRVKINEETEQNFIEMGRREAVEKYKIWLVLANCHR